jgi:hypothetical protein
MIANLTEPTTNLSGARHLHVESCQCNLKRFHVPLAHIGLEEQQPSTRPTRKLQPPKAQPSGTVQYSTVAAHLSSNPRTSPADPPGTCRRWRHLYQNADNFVSCSKQPFGQTFSATRDLATLGSTAPVHALATKCPNRHAASSMVFL